MNFIRKFVKRVWLTWRFLETWWRCLLARIPFDPSWMILGRFHVVRPSPFHAPAKIKIGKRLTVNSRLTNNCFGIIQDTIFFFMPGGELEIGNDFGISGSTLTVSTKIHIDEREKDEKSQLAFLRAVLTPDAGTGALPTKLRNFFCTVKNAIFPRPPEDQPAL